MNSKNCRVPKVRPKKWNSAIIGLHWLTVLLIVALFATGYLMKGLHEVDLHANIGAVLLVVLIVRLGVRFSTPAPGTGRSRRALAAYVLLYSGMFALLATGPSAVTRSAFVPTVRLFGEIQLPALIALNSSTAVMLHTWLGYGLLGTVALHLSAVVGHFFVGDRATLHRMLPWTWQALQ